MWWFELEGAEFYRYELATDENFDQISVASRTDDNGIQLDELTPGQYYLRVRGVDQYRLEGFDAVKGFVIEEPSDDSFALKLFLGLGVLLLAL